SPAVALGGFHSAAGWLGFNLVALGLVAVSQRWHILATAEELPNQTEAAPLTSAYLFPLFSFLATGLISRACTTATDALYRVRVLAVGVVLWHYRRSSTELRVSWSRLEVAVGGAAFGAWVTLKPAAAGESALQPLWADLPAAWIGPWLACRIFGAVVVVPLAE